MHTSELIFFDKSELIGMSPVCGSSDCIFLNRILFACPLRVDPSDFIFDRNQILSGFLLCVAQMITDF